MRIVEWHYCKQHPIQTPLRNMAHRLRSRVMVRKSIGNVRNSDGWHSSMLICVSKWARGGH